MDGKEIISNYRESTKWSNVEGKALFVFGEKEPLAGDLFPTYLIRELFVDMAKEIDKLNNRIEYLENRVEE